MIAAESITIVRGGRPLLDRLSMELRHGEVLAVLGPNGAGKSTLLRALSGELRPDGGRVTLEGTPIDRIRPRELARRRAVLPQHASVAFAMTARAVAALGRLPHDGDGGAVAAALRQAGVAHLADRLYQTLSGGEQQRVHLARVLAQLAGPEGAYLLLDEPVAALDIAHQLAICALARPRAQAGIAVLMVLHDVNLAARVADRVLLMRSGTVHAIGPPCTTLRPETLEPVFGVRLMERTALLPA
jgi:iron complex transport system ATP-binding protein